MRKVLIRLLVSVGISAILIYWLMSQGFDVLPSWEAIHSSAAWWAVPIYLALFSVFHILRAWRWSYLLRPFTNVPTRVMMQVAFSGFTAIQMMPLRTGEVARPYLLDRYTGTSKSALFGTIAIERVVDGLLVSVWLTATLFTISAENTPYVWGLRVIPLSIFLVALILLVAFYRSPNFVRRIVDKVFGLISPRLAEFTLGVLERFHGGLAALPDGRSLWAFVCMSILYWSINACSFYLLAVGCGIDLPFVGAVAGMGCLAVGILLPAGPGYFGNFQVAVLAALEMYVPYASSSQRAAVFIFLLYVLQTGMTVVFGAGGALGLKGRPVKSRSSVKPPLPVDAD
ncbi:MAG: flippase-like domain-containing protein [Proteobacteria bacterium]|nr:flippase-like domain-containing protein [Pseudomonadota bacterium]